MTDDADRAAKAMIAALRLLADSLPGMHEQQVAPGVISLMSGLPMATLNGVLTDAARPDVTELDRAAAVVAGLPLPWSIQFRGEPEPAAFAGGTAGVFNIATVPAYRGRGYGRAVTSRIVADGVARGADLAYLQSSEDGYPLYESMGFRTVETWTYLCSTSAA